MGVGLGAHGQRARPLNPAFLQSNLGAQRGQGQVLAVLHHRHGRWHEHLGCEELGVSLEGPEDQMSCEECCPHPTCWGGGKGVGEAKGCFAECF
ncbi:rCG42676, isoform CRA_b [Rattus norvegicus]|uniref:RCG42676, isoform CRA_b n=1 Tax=Rattus norvegicus TaxID=10116 RepID=A6K1F9_RAT|nr:rCG42676, isoform CRA_b [Rattus norvegicus]